ncbi:hypothetical protein CTA21_16440 [Salmonella enterica]|nr:hypothetical protein [Salmonella enterica]
MKKIIVAGLSLLALVADAIAVMAVAVALFQGQDSPGATMAVAILLFVMSLPVLFFSLRNHHKWISYVWFWVAMALIGFAGPTAAYPFYSSLPLVAVVAVWLVKRYWTVRAY